MKMRILSIFLLVCLFLLPACSQKQPDSETPGVYTAGFGSAVLSIPESSKYPLYIAGYHSGRQITGVLDLQQARAVWLDDGKTSIVLIAIDCVGLGSGTVKQIRTQLSDFCRETGCDSVNIISTHTHAGIDTLGLWGPVGMDGKNPDFMQTVVHGAVAAAKAAYEDRSTGALHYSVTPTEGLQADSREPQVYDNNLYQLRFVPDDAEKNGIRIVSFAAHAEALRGDNTKVSRDYPGIVCDRICEETGEDALYLPGAIGGLIMTPELVQEPFDAVKNLQLTGEKIAQYALSADFGRELTPSLSLSRVEFEVPLENTLFLYYKFLGILQNEVRQNLAGTYLLATELTVLRFGDLTLALLPGEVFPELITGTGKDTDPASLQALAKQHGVRDLMIVGLANDELGYILPPSDFVVDPELPFLQEAPGDHYEETNSVGKECAAKLAEAFCKALQAS